MPRSTSVWTLLVRPGGQVVVGVPDASDAQVVAGDLDVEAAFAVRSLNGIVARRPGKP